MLASKLFVVILAIGAIHAKPLEKEESNFEEDAASEIKHIKEELKELKDHPEDKEKDAKIQALIDEVKTLKDDVIEKKKEEEIEKDVKVEKEEVAEDSEDAIVATYKNEIDRIKTALKDPKTAKNKAFMELLKDQAKHVQFEVQQKIKELNDAKNKDVVPEVVVPELEMKDEELITEKEDEEQMDALEVEEKREAEKEDDAIEFKKDVKDKLVQIHDHLENVKTYLEEKKKDAQIDGQIMNDASLNDIKLKLHDVHDKLVRVRDHLAEAEMPAVEEADETFDEGVQPILPEKVMPSHDALVEIKKKLKDIKTRIEENPIKDEKVKRVVAVKLQKIKEKLRDMVSKKEDLEIIDENDAPVPVPALVEDAPKPAPKSVKQELADSMVRIKGKLLHIQKELRDTPITDKNVKRDVAAKLHMIHDKLADVASVMTIPADTPEVHRNPLADQLHGIKEKLLDVKAKLLKDPITDEAEKEAVKRSLEKIHEKLSDFAGRIEEHALIEEDVAENNEAAEKDAAPAPVPVRLDEKLHQIKEKMVAIRDELKENPALLEDPAVKKAVEEKLGKIRSRMRDFVARSGVNSALVGNDMPEKKVEVTVEKKNEVNDAPLKLKLHDIKNRLLRMKDVLTNHPIKDAAVKEQVEKRLMNIHQKLRDVAAHMGVDEALSEVEKSDVPEKDEIIKPKPSADHLEKLDMKLVKVKLDHIKEMLKDHPITNDAVKEVVREKLHHIQNELKDYAQQNVDIEMDEKVTEEKADEVKVGVPLEIETKEDEKANDAKKLATIHDKLDQIREKIIAHPLKDASMKKVVEEKLHIIKDTLKDYADKRGYEIESAKDIPAPVPAKIEDAKKVEEIVVPEVPEKKDAPAPAPANDAEEKRYDALEERLKQIRDELITNPIKDENTRTVIDSKLKTIEAKLLDVQQKTADEVTEKKEEIIVPKPEMKKDAVKEKPELLKDLVAEREVPAKVVVPEDVPEKKEAIELPAIKEDEVKVVPAVVEVPSTEDQEKEAKKDELEERLSQLKDEMKELKKEYADVSEEKVAKDEKETEKSQAAANDVPKEITDWEAELDAMHE